VSPLKVVTILGTRPEIIRLSCLIPKLDRHCNHILVHTGQNNDPNLSDIFFEELGLRSPDYYLGVSNSSLGGALSDTFKKIEEVLLTERPEAVMILGDTNSAFSAILAERMGIPVYHMEAGNRSFDPRVPEELNRKVVDHVSSYNLPYSEHARTNLLREGLHPNKIFKTGSPIGEVYQSQKSKIDASAALTNLHLEENGFILASIHRQENVDSPELLKRVLESLVAIQEKWQLPILMSTHPRTRKKLVDLGISSIPGIAFHEPFGFLDYAKLQKSARFVVSDSGTISEEAAILGFKAVSLRDYAERPEAVESGAIVLTGLDKENIIQSIQLQLEGSSEIPPDYSQTEFSTTVLKIVLSTSKRNYIY
jgi:UDP-N-acetylglucosamine 2-epimerase